MHLESNTAEETPRHLVDFDKAPLVAGRIVRALAYSTHLLIGEGLGGSSLAVGGVDGNTSGAATQRGAKK